MVSGEKFGFTFVIVIRAHRYMMSGKLSCLHNVIQEAKIIIVQ